MDNDLLLAEIGDCACCEASRPLVRTQIPVAELMMIGHKMIMKTGRTLPHDICGICGNEVIQGILLVTQDGHFIYNTGEHYADKHKKQPPKLQFHL